MANVENMKKLLAFYDDGQPGYEALMAASGWDSRSCAAWAIGQLVGEPVDISKASIMAYLGIEDADAMDIFYNNVDGFTNAHAKLRGIRHRLNTLIARYDEREEPEGAAV